jgi:hypothetical protein
MKLDRNIHERGLGKYALLKLRKLTDFTDPADPFQEVAKPIVDAITTLEKAGILDWGDKPESEFFVMRLKDKYSRCALHAYADEARRDGEKEFSDEVSSLAMRSGLHHPNCKKPD